jgi:hypothetical protein
LTDQLSGLEAYTLLSQFDQRRKEMFRLKVTIVVALIMLYVPGSNRCAAQASHVIGITITSENPNEPKGSEAIVVVKLTNLSDHDIFYSEDGPGRSFDFQVLDERGNAVKETAFGMKQHGTDPNRKPWVGSVFSFPWKSGETLTRKVALGKEYDLSTPGLYRVSVTCRDAVRPYPVITSNEIAITVLSK